MSTYLAVDSLSVIHLIELAKRVAMSNEPVPLSKSQESSSLDPLPRCGSFSTLAMLLLLIPAADHAQSRHTTTERGQVATQDKSIDRLIVGSCPPSAFKALNTLQRILRDS